MVTSAEELVERCFLEHKEDVTFYRTLRNSPLDRKKVDFLDVRHRATGITASLQVKTSTSGKTIGISLPSSYRELQGFNGTLTSRMRSQIHVYSRYSNVLDGILFVARVGHRQSEPEIIQRIWSEIGKLFAAIGHNRRRKERTARLIPVLANRRRLCYTRGVSD